MESDGVAGTFSVSGPGFLPQYFTRAMFGWARAFPSSTVCKCVRSWLALTRRFYTRIAKVVCSGRNGMGNCGGYTVTTMHSLRLTLFMLLSLVGHAAVLVPVSGYLAALFESTDIESETVTVFISVISNTVPAESEPVGAGQSASLSISSVHQPASAPERATSEASPKTELSEPVRSESREAEAAAAEPPRVEAPAAAEPEVGDAFTDPHNGPDVPARQNMAATAESAESIARRRSKLQAEEKYLAELLNEISKYRVYPTAARKKGYQGGVEVDVTILRNGEFESIEISKPSDYRVLDRASARAVSRLKRFKPFPAEIERESWHISIPFRYVLNANQFINQN